MKVELNFLEKFNLAKICLEVFLAFVRSGWSDIDGGVVNAIGGYGYYWSLTAESAFHAYDLVLGFTEVYPSYGAGRRNAFPLRCLYPGSA